MVAVSGGVDSMALLHLLHGRPGVELVVAHFEHGVREDSDEDRKLVQKVAEGYRLPFVFKHGNLGAAVSEEKARHARYQFLHETKQQMKARAIITAHHQDDVIETAILNLIRGTGRKGLTSLSSHDDLLRPLLNVPKLDIIGHAKTHNLQWREDSTNESTNYLRNYIRQNGVPRLGAEGKKSLLKILRQTEELNAQIDEEITQMFDLDSDQLDRKLFILLPHAVSKEVMASWLRAHELRNFDQKTLERLVVAAKTFAPNQKANIISGKFLSVQKSRLKIV